MLPGLMVPPGLMGSVEDFPVIEGTSAFIAIGTASSHNVPLPSGVQSGDLVLIALCTGSSNNPIASTPADWTSIGHTATAPAPSQVRVQVFCRVASGALSQVSIELSVSANIVAVIYRISSFTGLPEVKRHFGLDGPILSPSWGAKKTLWMPMIGYSSTSSSPWTPPPNYTDPLRAHSSDYNRGIVSSVRFLKASSEDSGAYSGPSALNVDGYLVAVQGK